MAPKKVVKKGRKKRWFPLVAPALFNNKPLGETYVYEAEELKDKTVKVNLMSLTNDFKKQHINTGFYVSNIKDGAGQTAVYSYEMMPSYVKRLVRRGRDKIDDSFLVRDKNSTVVRIKPLIITRTRTHGSVLTAMRKKLRNVVAGMVEGQTFEQSLDNIIAGKFQREIKNKLQSIYPIRSVEIRQIHLVRRDGSQSDENEPIVTEADTAKELEAAEEKPAKKELPKEEATEAPAQEAKEETKDAEEQAEKKPAKKKAAKKDE